MRKIMLLFTVSIFTVVILGACNNDDSQDKGNPEVETEDVKEPADNVEDSANEDSGSNNGFFEVTVEDQVNLSVGDTGVFQSTLGTYELTVETAEIVGKELDGEGSLLDELIVLDLTFKNIGDNVLKAEELMHSMEMTDDLDGSGFSNGASEFESIDLFEGELQPGEERATQFLGDIRTADEYFFRKDQGNVKAGTSNQVIWKIPDEEARN